MTNKAAVKSVWITGAGKGIGRALAKRMAVSGWQVAVSARTESDLISLQHDCPPGSIHVFPLDVTNAELNESVFHQIETRLGSVDLVILNAGTHTPNPIVDFTVESFRKLVETNLMGTVHGLVPVIRSFTGRRAGHIAVVASLAGYRGLPSASAYGATKAGLINMCEALKVELEPYNVRLSLINPGFVETPLTDKNLFPMPFLVPVEQAIDYILRGLERNQFEISFPKRFSFLLKLMRILPDRLFFAMSRRMLPP